MKFFWLTILGVTPFIGGCAHLTDHIGFRAHHQLDMTQQHEDVYRYVEYRAKF